MGAGMAGSMLRAGLPVRAWNRTPAKARALEPAGAAIAATPADAVRNADVIVTILADGDAVLEAVAADAAEASSGDGSGALLVARSTVTLRTGCGALTGNRAVAGMGTGPDSSSGTTNTMSTAKIEAPTKRSLTRRSIACQP